MSASSGDMPATHSVRRRCTNSSSQTWKRNLPSGSMMQSSMTVGRPSHRSCAMNPMGPSGRSGFSPSRNHTSRQKRSIRDGGIALGMLHARQTGPLALRTTPKVIQNTRRQPINRALKATITQLPTRSLRGRRNTSRFVAPGCERLGAACGSLGGVRLAVAISITPGAPHTRGRLVVTPGLDRIRAPFQ